MFALVAMAGLAKEIKMNDSRGDRHLGYSSRHTQVSLTFASDYRDCSIFMKLFL